MCLNVYYVIGVPFVCMYMYVYTYVCVYVCSYVCVYACVYVNLCNQAGTVMDMYV